MTTVARYIARRLKELGANHLFCVPGNYTAEFLLAADEEGIACIGTTSELEAGYAADAYSRYRKIGVCSATYGVGSHSLYNAISGAFVEFCPVVLINGSPPPEKIKQLEMRGILFAHAIDTIRTDELIFRSVTAATEIIRDPFDAPERIDRILNTCVRSSRPVYLEVHQGVWSLPCDEPARKVRGNDPCHVNADQEAATDAAVNAVFERIEAASNPVIWGGEMLQRRGLSESFREIVESSELPYTTTLMAKSILPETDYPNQFIGVYDSKFAPAAISSVVEKSDCLVALGTILSDFYADVVVNSYERMILASDDSVRLGHLLYRNVPLTRFVHRLADRFAQADARTIELPGFEDLKRSRRASGLTAAPAASSSSRDGVTYADLFERLADWLTADMVLLVDTSLALFPSAEVIVRRRDGFLAQTAWLSIGYTNGAGLGVGLATGAIPVIVVGDGGFQMLPQAFSTLVRQQQPAVVFVLDNANYAIEQYLVDMQILPEEKRFFQNRLAEPSFFDVLPRWDYVRLAKAMGGRGVLAKNVSELDDVFSSRLSTRRAVPTLVAVRIHPHDLPPEIAATIPAAGFDATRSAGVAFDGFN